MPIIHRRNFIRAAALALVALMISTATQADDYAGRSAVVLDYLNTHPPNLTQFGSGPHRIGRTGFWFGEGRLLRGDLVNGTNFINTAIGDACAENPNAGFSLWPGMDAWYRWGNLFSAAMLTNDWNAYTICALYDNGATPNQQFMDATARYLAGEMFPGATFSSGAAYGYGDLSGKALVKAIVERVPRYNFPEANANHYLRFTLAPMRTLADFAPDADLRHKAGMAFDWAVADAAPAWLNGHWCVSSLRGAAATQAYNYDITPLSWWLLFGGPTPVDLLESAESASYAMPQFPGVLPEILMAATNRTQTYTRRSLAERQVGRETVYYKQTYMARKYALWSQVEGEVGFNADGSFILKNLNVPTVSDGYQGQRWALAWDDQPTSDSVLTITTPTTYSGTTSGISIYEDTLQLEDTLLAVYNIPASGGTGGNDGSTPNQWINGHIPQGRLAVIDDSTNSGRIFLHYTNVLVAIYFTTNFNWAAAADFTVPCSKMGLALETARTTEYPQALATDRLAAFRSDVWSHGVNADAISAASPRLIYTNHNGATLDLTYGLAGITNGVTVDYLSWPMEQSPWTYQAHLGNLFIFGPNRTVIYDFKNWMRLTNNAPTMVSSAADFFGNTALPIDLALHISDSETPGSNLLFRVLGASNGTAALLPDGHTVQFSPATNFSGNGSVTVAATDQGIDPRLVLAYDFANNGSLTSNSVPDISLNARTASVSKWTSGGTVLYDTNGPPLPGNAPAPSIRLNGARLTCNVTPGNLNLVNAGWTFATWFRRATKSDEDFIFYLGSGDGFSGSGDELQLDCPANQNIVALNHYNTNNALDFSLVSPAMVSTGAWHHVAVTFQPTADNTGTVRLWLDGAAAGVASNLTWALPQTNALVFGGQAINNNANTNRWFNGWLGDLALFRGALTAEEISRLATMSVASFGGFTVTNLILVGVPQSHTLMPANISASSSQSAYPPALAVDGNDSTFWVSSNAPSASPQWLLVNFSRRWRCRKFL